MPPSTPSFPLEVIEQIFALFSTTLSTSDLAHFPWFLGHICSTWRSLYLSMTVEFWRSISISFNTRCMHTTKLAVQFFLERNPETPFSFDFHFPCHSRFSYCQMDTIRSIFEVLIAGSMRWEGAKIYCYRPVDLLPLIQAKNRLLLLRELELSFADDEVIPVIPVRLRDVFETAPSLNIIKMCHLTDWKFNWPNLKTICLYGLESSTVVAALPQMTRLERLNLSSIVNPVPSSVIFMPSLNTLFCYSNWLTLLNTPALTQLMILCCDSGSENNSINITLSFLRRSSCNILRLGIGYVQAATAIEIIRHVPEVTYLHFTMIKNIRSLFEQLTAPPNQSQELLARRLISLEVSDVSSVFDDDMGPFRDLILSRTISDNICGFQKLQELNLSGPWNQVSDAMYDGLICLCKERGVVTLI